jgi:Holliday junction resolvase
MPPISFNSPSDVMEQESFEQIAQRYRDEGYGVVPASLGAQVPPFLAGFQPDLIATRGNEGIVVEIKTNRIDLSRDDKLTQLAEIVSAQPGWRLDVVVLEPVTTVEKAAQETVEPSDEQLREILKVAEEMADKGYVPYACVIAWSGFEAAMRRIRNEAELYGMPTPTELMRTLYGNGFLDKDQFVRLKEAYKIRSQVVHGLVSTGVDPALVHFVTATARQLAYDPEGAVSTS